MSKTRSITHSENRPGYVETGCCVCGDIYSDLIMVTEIETSCFRGEDKVLFHCEKHCKDTKEYKKYFSAIKEKELKRVKQLIQNKEEAIRIIMGAIDYVTIYREEDSFEQYHFEIFIK